MRRHLWISDFKAITNSRMTVRGLVFLGTSIRHGMCSERSGALQGIPKMESEARAIKTS